MKNPLELFKPKHKKQQELKDRVLKNKEAMLDVMAENIKGARQCPLLMGQKCIGVMCEFFMEFKTVNNETGDEFKYCRCTYTQTPILLIEMIQELVRLNKLLQEFTQKR